MPTRNSDHVLRLENVLYLLAELEQALARGDIAWSVQDLTRSQARLERILACLAETAAKPGPRRR